MDRCSVVLGESGNLGVGHEIAAGAGPAEEPTDCGDVIGSGGSSRTLGRANQDAMFRLA